MILKSIEEESFNHYKVPAMLLATPFCSFKCEKDCGVCCCQNSPLVLSPNINISISAIIEKYLNNQITHAVVFGGLEPFDSWNDVQNFILNFRYRSDDDIVIYTGYNKEEISEDKLDWLKLYAADGTIIIKWGRFIPNQKPHFDKILGVDLASDNQYAEEI